MSDEDLIRRGDAANICGKHSYSNNQYVSMRMIDAANEIRALPAVQVGVKPLEWLEIRHGQYFEARVIGILYSVRLGTDGISRWQAGHMGTWRDAPTIEAAKAAAQADYDSRIRSALTAQPSPDVAALVAALEMARDLLEPFADPDLSLGLGGNVIPKIDAALARLKGGAA